MRMATCAHTNRIVRKVRFATVQVTVPNFVAIFADDALKVKPELASMGLVDYGAILSFDCWSESLRYGHGRKQATTTRWLSSWLSVQWERNSPLRTINTLRKR